MLVLFIQLKSRITAAWKLVIIRPPLALASIMVEIRMAKATESIPIDWS
jgi:hypothetical protein